MAIPSHVNTTFSQLGGRGPLCSVRAKQLAESFCVKIRTTKLWEKPGKLILERLCWQSRNGRPEQVSSPETVAIQTGLCQNMSLQDSLHHRAGPVSLGKWLAPCPRQRRERPELPFFNLAPPYNGKAWRLLVSKTWLNPHPQKLDKPGKIG